MSAVAPSSPTSVAARALVQFQLGLFREVVRVPAGNLSYRHAKRLAAEIIERKAPECSVVGAGEKILLFRHQLTSDQLLHRLTEHDELQDGDLIEVIISGSASVTEMRIRPHSLVVYSYRTPTFCHHCGEMLWGLVRQGLKCDGKRSSSSASSNLIQSESRTTNLFSTSVCLQGVDWTSTSAAPSSCQRLQPSAASGQHQPVPVPAPTTADTLAVQSGGRQPGGDQHVQALVQASILGGAPRVAGGSSRPQVPHTFHIHSYTKPTVCQYCHRLLKGLFRQGLQCSDCKFNCHRRCEPLVSRDCPGERRGVNGEESPAAVHTCPLAPDDAESELTSVTTLDLSDDDMSTDGDSPAEIKEVEPLREPISPCFSSYIPLMRLVQSVHHTKRRAGGVLREGWLLHHTNTDTLRKRHYWILDRKSITLYQNECSTKYYKVKALHRHLHHLHVLPPSVPLTPSSLLLFLLQEIPLSEVLQVRGHAQLSVPVLPGPTAHSFEVETASLVYCVVAGEDGPLWESAIRQGLMPVEENHCEQRTTNTNKYKQQNSTSCLTLTIFCPPLSSDDYPRKNSMDISSVYQICTDEVLGSGQFGVVYRGTHRMSGRPVAIKCIDKTRFPAKQERQLRNEVSILQNLTHLGVVLLEGMFETGDHVFVVMEKLHGDMLEMIMSSENGRLPERNTRFLSCRSSRRCGTCTSNTSPTVTSNLRTCSWPRPTPFLSCVTSASPASSVRSLFAAQCGGTPAYLAPEVISSSGYNRSLDMWSVGVIMYVSLSGTFPFNEDEDIKQQITNAAFMYPRQTWASISLESDQQPAAGVGEEEVQRGKALGHSWLQDFQLWCDLREFEQRMGRRYLTHQDEEERWIHYAQERGLDFPSYPCQDPEHNPD
ncbi:hypothetical protein INR49_002845, partial [Caranx melampygus]